MYNSPATEEPPEITVHFRDDTLRLPLPLGNSNVLTDNHRFPDRQVDYAHLEEHAEDMPILHKTHGKTLPTEVDSNFDI